MKTIGIDLGTTNTVASLDAAVLHQVVGTQSTPIVPSVVAFPPNGLTLVGMAAKTRRSIDPQNTIFSAKRLMGQSWLSYNANKFKKQYPFDLVETDDGRCGFQTRAGVFTPENIGARVIQKVFSNEAVGSDVRLIITVPAAFDDKARLSTIEAGKQAGVGDITTVEEPVATAMAYLTTRREKADYAAVYDFGGGTFDLAILDCRQNPATVINHGGDAYLGGDDIDQAIAHWAADDIIKRFNWDLHASPDVFDRLTVQCERAKVRLSFAQKTTIEMSQVDPASTVAGETVSIDRDQLRGLAQEHIKRTFIICDEVLRDSKLSASDIDAVYLAGGTTMLPLVRESVAKYFGTEPRCEFDPMEVVSIGASLVAAVM